MTGREQTSLGERLWVALILLVCLGFGSVMGANGWSSRQRDAILDERGQPATATVTALNRKSVTIAFTTADGRPAGARIHTATEAALGDRVRVVYDPADPSGNVADPAEPQAAMTYWFQLLSGAAMVLLALYGIWWHLRHGAFHLHRDRTYRDRQRDRRQRIERQRAERRHRRGGRR